MKLIAVAVLLFAVPAAAAQRDFTPAERQEAVQLAATARRALDIQLLDHPSARFRTVVALVPREAKGVRLCGWVNSKNRLGAYTGWQPFVFLDELSFDPIMIEVLCDFDGSDTDNRDYSAAVSAGS